MEPETCFKCGIVFGVPDGYIFQRRKDKESFWCPNGHSQAYIEGELERVRKDLEAKLAARDRTIADRELSLSLLRNEHAKPWRCPHCPRRYVGRDGLLSHVSRAHGVAHARALPETAGPDAHGDQGIRHNVVSIKRKR